MILHGSILDPNRIAQWRAAPASDRPGWAWIAYQPGQLHAAVTGHCEHRWQAVKAASDAAQHLAENAPRDVAASGAPAQPTTTGGQT